MELPTPGRPLVVVLGAILLLASTARAGAQDIQVDDPVAERHLEAGVRRFEVGDFAQAVAEFKAGYLVGGNPVFLFLLGQTERKAGDCAKAVDEYHSFLASHPSAALASTARHGLEECEHALAASPRETVPASPPGARIDQQPPGPRIPSPASAAPDATSADTVSHMAPSALGGVGVGVGEPEGAAPAWYRDRLGDTLAGAGLLGLTVGAVFLVVANSQVDAMRTAPSYAAFVQAQSGESFDRGAGIVTMTAGGLLGAGAVARWALVARSGHTSTMAVSAPVPGGFACTLAGRF